MAKTNKGLVEYAKAQLGNPYWYGTFGQKSSESLYKQKKKQYPSYYTATDFKNQYGVKVHDCIGLIKGYVWCDSPTDTTPNYAKGMPDVNEEMMYNLAKEKGSISTMPDIAGICVLFKGHIGVYIGNGYVIEAKGHAYGVVKTKLAGRGWTKWCKCPYIEYEEEKKTVSTTKKKKYTGTFPSVTPNLKKGSKGKQVGYLQKFLNWYGKYGLAVDNDFGSKTEKAVKNYQKAEKLVVDGIFGTKSLAQAKKIKK